MSADTSVPKQREAVGLDDFESWRPDAMLRNTPAGVAFVGTDTRFVWVNAALARMYGHDPAEFAGRPVAEMWPAKDTDAEDAKGGKDAKSGKDAKDKDAARAEATLRRVLDEDQAATETSENHRVYHWFPVHGPDGAMLEDSPEWRLITGQTEEEFLGGGWLDSIHPEDRERVQRDWRECLRTGRIFDDRFRMRTRAGAYRHYDVRAVPIERDGEIAEWVGACTDVTSHREAAAGDVDARRGTRRGAGGRGHHRGGPHRDR